SSVTRVTRLNTPVGGCSVWAAAGSGSSGPADASGAPYVNTASQLPSYVASVSMVRGAGSTFSSNPAAQLSGSFVSKIIRIYKIAVTFTTSGTQLGQLLFLLQKATPGTPGAAGTIGALDSTNAATSASIVAGSNVGTPI